jgi:hypothetical protein
VDGLDAAAVAAIALLETPEAGHGRTDALDRPRERRRARAAEALQEVGVGAQMSACSASMSLRACSACALRVQPVVADRDVAEPRREHREPHERAERDGKTGAVDDVTLPPTPDRSGSTR